jgi:preprotein translocase subunit SecG
MENVLLVILLILALALIAVVLMQRSEGGGLGIGGGGGVMSARGAATALGKVTWGLGIAFLAMSLAMTVVSARNAADSSVIDRVEDTAPATDTPAVPGTALPTIEDLVPQTDSATDAPADTPATGDAPETPPRAD